jgi:hypothetical protein
VQPSEENSCHGEARFCKRERIIGKAILGCSATEAHRQWLAPLACPSQNDECVRAAFGDQHGQALGGESTVRHRREKGRRGPSRHAVETLSWRGATLVATRASPHLPSCVKPQNPQLLRRLHEMCATRPCRSCRLNPIGAQERHTIGCAVPAPQVEWLACFRALGLAPSRSFLARCSQKGDRPG